MTLKVNLLAVWIATGGNNQEEKWSETRDKKNVISRTFRCFRSFKV